MSVVRRRVDVPAAGNIDVNLAPFDRFGGRGGRATVKATATATEEDDITFRFIIGSDIIAEDYAVSAERNVGEGPSQNTKSVQGIGAPADPIALRLFNANVAIRTVDVEVEIEFA